MWSRAGSQRMLTMLLVLYASATITLSGRLTPLPVRSNVMFVARPLKQLLSLGDPGLVLHRPLGCDPGGQPGVVDGRNGILNACVTDAISPPGSPLGRTEYRFSVIGCKNVAPGVVVQPVSGGGDDGTMLWQPQLLIVTVSRGLWRWVPSGPTWLNCGLGRLERLAEHVPRRGKGRCVHHGGACSCRGGQQAPTASIAAR